MNSLSHKAHDISFAVFRVATLIKNRKLREELENAAVDFTVNYQNILNHPSGHFATVFDKLERLISLAGSIKEMKEINANVLKRELNSFQTAVLNQLQKDNWQDIDLSDDFGVNTDGIGLDADGTPSTRAKLGAGQAGLNTDGTGICPNADTGWRYYAHN